MPSYKGYKSFTDSYIYYKSLTLDHKTIFLSNITKIVFMQHFHNICLLGSNTFLSEDGLSSIKKKVVANKANNGSYRPPSHDIDFCVHNQSKEIGGT